LFGAGLLPPLPFGLSLTSGYGGPVAIARDGDGLCALRRVGVIGRSRPCEEHRDKAIQSHAGILDCFVASLLAMTAIDISPTAPSSPASRAG
jgi:hypothetical protein